jgi:hypothetical protein
VARVFAIEIEGSEYPFKLRPPAAKKILNHQPVFVRLAFTSPCKNRDTSGGPRREPGQAVALATKHSSLVTQLSRHGAAIAYTDLLCGVFLIIKSFSLSSKMSISPF